MLLDFNTKYVIVGHSERRTVFHEDGNSIGKKVRHIIVNSNLNLIICVGENISQRNASTHKEHIKEQIKDAFRYLEINQISQNTERVNIAYEPVWAIGTGVSASPSQVQCVAIT